MKECNHNFATFLFSSILSQNRRRDPFYTFRLVTESKHLLRNLFFFFLVCDWRGCTMHLRIARLRI